MLRIVTDGAADLLPAWYKEFDIQRYSDQRAFWRRRHIFKMLN
jgi:hypothetical protein